MKLFYFEIEIKNPGIYQIKQKKIKASFFFSNFERESRLFVVRECANLN